MKDSALIKALPQQQRAIATRAALLATVEDIVAAEGAEAVTTTRVAAEAGTAVGTIYRYFADREAMLLAAFDESAARLVAISREELRALPEDAPVEEAARHILDVYLKAAEAIPAHAGLLKAMRGLRPVDAARSPDLDQVVTEIIGPFFARFASSAQPDQLRLYLMGAVLSTLVDLYLVTSDESHRAMLRNELEAHLVFMLGRVV